MGLKLHYNPPSTFSRRVLIEFAEKQIPHQLVVVDMAARRHREQPYLSLNPYGRVPTLEEDGFVLFEFDGNPQLFGGDTARPAFGSSRCARPCTGRHAHEAVRFASYPTRRNESFFPNAFCRRNDGMPLLWLRLRPRLRNTWRYSISSLPARPIWLPNSSRLPRCATCRSWIFLPLMEITPPTAVAAGRTPARSPERGYYAPREVIVSRPTQLATVSSSDIDVAVSRAAQCTKSKA